ncbi:MAG: MATE family efflux transporter [Faecalibacterium sp.]
MANKYEESLGMQPMLPLIIRMAIPSVAAQIVNLLYSVVDRIYIGRIPEVGTTALAGIGITASLLALISAFAQVVGAGGAPLAAIALGGGDRVRAGRILGNGFVMLMFFALMAMSISFFFMEPILYISGASNATIDYARDYLSIYLIGTFFVMITAGLNSYINCQGRPQIAMCSVLLGAVLNIVLDPIFIFVFDMGVRGAALATILSQAVSAIWILRFLTSKEASLRLEVKYMKLDFKIIGAVCAVGVSPFVMASTECLVGVTLNSTLVNFGDIYVSALTVLQSAMQIISVPLVGFTQGFIPIISYNYGHGNTARVKQGVKIIISIMFVANMIATLFMICFPGVIARLFTTDETLIAVVIEVMPVFLTGMLVFGLQRACQNIFLALGEAKISLFIALLRKVILLIPLVLILSRFGYIGVYAAEAIADGTAAILCATLFFFRFRVVIKQMEAKDAERIEQVLG